MDIKDILERIKNNTLEISEAQKLLADLPFEDIGYAKVDHHREIRSGYPEVIFGLGKTVEQIKGIVNSLSRATEKVILVTKTCDEVYQAVKQEHPSAVYHELAKMITINNLPEPKEGSYVAVICAGTCDIPIAEEACVTLSVTGSKVERIYDVGVAGIHRLFANGEKIKNAKAVIVVAGMDGALPSVVAGSFAKMVIAVPTSAGYGASFGGVSALLTMLNSCSVGVSVVNIDNGFGAGFIATMINKG